MTLPSLAAPRRRSCTRLIRGWLLLAGSIGVLFAAEPGRMSFDIPADTAENALKRLSEQSGVEVLFPTEVAVGVRTNAVKGEMTARAALDAMLAGTGLVAAEGKATGALTVRRSSGLDAGPVRPTAAGEQPDVKKKVLTSL